MWRGKSLAPELRRRWTLLVGGAWAAVVLGAGCGARSSLTEIDKQTPADYEKTEQSHLLRFPIGDGESLLGRPVKQTRDGAWTIADQRAPGCQVHTRAHEAAYKVKRRVEYKDLTSLAVSFAKVINAHAKHGAADTVDIDIDNVEVIEGDFSGSCGEVVVSRVFVGTGKRSLLRTKNLEGEISGAVSALTPGYDREASGKEADDLQWDTPQAYGFQFDKVGKSEPLEVEASIPSIVVEGDEVVITMRTNQEAYLIVYYLDESGAGVVLWPSNEETAPRATPEMPAALPSEAERRAGIVLRAVLAKPGVSTRETLVVYAFARKDEFDRVKPTPGLQQADGAAMAADLTKRVENLPISRWSRVIRSYEITPRGE